jgi:hypothetical protein
MPNVRLASLRYGPAYSFAVEPAYPEPSLNVVAGQALTSTGPLPLVAASLEHRLNWDDALRTIVTLSWQQH